MKKIAHVILYNHMDPVWRRCFINHFRHQDMLVRPYIDIEEAELNQWLDFVSTTELRYSIEQTLTTKKFLERNPDKFDRLKSYVNSGKIEILGSGETGIDYNLVSGESIVRNHLYSIRWCEEIFGQRPQIGWTTDCFGLSAQVPQIFRQLGYEAMIRYDNYIFQNSKMYWRGLNGDLLMFKREFDDLGIQMHIHCDICKLLVCENCSGDGCEVCNHTGMDYSYRAISYYTDTDEIFKRIAGSEFDKHRLVIFSEETLKYDDFYEQMEALSKKYDIELDYCTNIEFYEKNFQTELEALRAGNVDEDKIDLRLETSEAAKGCNTTHVALKQMNRKLENMLLAAEKFAAFATCIADAGYDYPRKKIAYLWNQMAIIHTHDGITACSVDAVIDELQALGKNIALGAEQVFLDAARVIERNVEIKHKEGYKPFIIFNPLNWTVKDNITKAVVSSDKDFDISSIEIINENGKKLDVIDFKITSRQKEDRITIKFKGAELPSLGYSVFYYKLLEIALVPVASLPVSSEKLETHSSRFIENEFYKISFSKSMITSVTDIELGKETLRNIDMVVEADLGSSWDTFPAAYVFSESITNPFFLEYVTKRDATVTCEVISDSNRSVLVFSGEYKNDDREIRSLKWKQTVTLYNGIKKIYFKTDLDWDGRDHKIMTVFPLTFKPVDDEAYYEIPYGTVKRGSYSIDTNGNRSSETGDWCAVNFTSVYNKDEDYTMTLINKGIPGQKVIDGVLQLSLLRSPTQGPSLFSFDKAKQIGKHSMSYVVTSSAGDLKNSKVVQKGAEINAHYYSFLATAKEGKLKPKQSFLVNKNENVLISAVKKCEDENKLLVRAYEAYGEAAEDELEFAFGSVDLQESDLLEKKSIAKDCMQFNGFDIKTFKF